ncbi:MAG: O-antigen ligase family protein [Candidatus Chisholmbacteria bacterium]|nr:O-antigen ligase family protein [Candidatus Chisholmbacteria bacterium]
MPSIKKLFVWFDDHILLVLASFLFVFIPLYPKFPLFDIIPGYIVRVRLEDFLVAATLLIWLVQVIRQKAKFHSLLLIPMVAYLVIGLLSMVSAVLLTHTVPMQFDHIGKMVLHWARRIEYFSLYFVFYSAVTSIRTVKRLMILFGLTAIAATIYGIGQKLYQWPVYSTMNREFAKGWKLVLTEHARVPSTFAGHYDFAAYLVLFLSISAAIFLFVKKEPVKVVSLFGFTAALVSLVLTASRASFIAYLIAITVMLILFALRRSWLWAAKRWVVLIAVSLVFSAAFGELASRFSHFFNFARISGFIKYDVLKIQPAPEYLRLTDNLALVLTPSDTPPVPAGSSRRTDGELPPDVFEDIPDGLIATTSADGTATISAQSRQYSDAAFTFGLSSAIRFDALWPRAIKGFLNNPLLGSGYSTLTKARITDFTEAESTDNDFLRALGETGLLGFLAFYGMIGYALWYSWKNREYLRASFVYAVVVGIAAGTIGLLVNALYIDVFEASKVAFMFWALMGIFVATVERISLRHQKRPAA